MNLTGDRCMCNSCGRYFTSTSAFDVHRVIVEPAPNYKRRCMTDEELSARGLAPNPEGFWRVPMRECVRRLA